MWHNYYCFVASLVCDKLSTGCLKCYTTAAFCFPNIKHFYTLMQANKVRDTVKVYTINGTEGEKRYSYTNY